MYKFILNSFLKFNFIGLHNTFNIAKTDSLSILYFYFSLSISPYFVLLL